MQAQPERELSDDYYLTNFHALTGFVSAIYSDILSAEEKRWYSNLSSSSDSAQRLYIRLLMRKKSVFRLSRLRYPEISCLVQASSELAEIGLACIHAPKSVDLLLGAFTKPELVAKLDGVISIPRASTIPRIKLIENILAVDESVLQRYLSMLRQDDKWISPLGHGVWSVFRLCFFGNLYQDSSEFVLRDLGTLRYENYPLDSASRVFMTRAQMDAHLRYFECATLIDTIDQKDADQLIALTEIMPPPIDGDIHLQRRLDRLRNNIARQLERLDRIDDALRLYTISVSPPARERLVRIHLASRQLDRAAKLVSSMVSQPFNDAELQVALRLQIKIDKAAGRKPAAGTRFRPETSRLVLNPSEHRVELAAQNFAPVDWIFRHAFPDHSLHVQKTQACHQAH